MAAICYHASHEQFSPSDLLNWAQLAEAAGFDAIHSSDHFHPWSKAQGQSGFSFAWLGAAMQATSLPYGVICAPGGRYHPAVIAQAAATLAEMFPNRFWLELGSGEALNESITGEPWPEKHIRNQRLYESAQIIQQLFQGKQVTHSGAVTVKNASLYTRPVTPPPMIAAAVTTETAAWLGSWANGLLTVHKPPEEMKEMINAFKNNGGRNKPLYLKIQLSYAESYEEAMNGGMEQWRTNVLSSDELQNYCLPEQYDAAADNVTPDQIKKMVLISEDPLQHILWINEYIDMGFDHIILHNVNRNQELFIRDFGQNVLPYLRK